MRKILLFTALCLALLSPRLSAVEMPWQVDYDKALAEAKTEHRPVLLDFSASWCGPCRMMETTTFADANVQQKLETYKLVKIDLDRNPMLAARYKVQAIPTCIVLNEFAELVNRHTGYADAIFFNHWLVESSTRERAQAREPKSQELVETVQLLAKGLEAKDPGMREGSVANLLQLYCAKAPDADNGGRVTPASDSSDPSQDAPTDDNNAGAKLVEDALRGFVKQHGLLAAGYLNERRLAVRILFAKLFAETAGPDFQFDPWAPSSARAAAVETWGKRLGEH